MYKCYTQVALNDMKIPIRCDFCKNSSDKVLLYLWKEYEGKIPEGRTPQLMTVCRECVEGFLSMLG